MMNAPTVVACAFAVLGSATGLAAQGLSQYREFALGSDVATVSARANIPVASAKTLHQRPAVLQALEWRLPRWTANSSMPSTDPVEQIHFSFYNDQLFRFVVDYRYDRIEGLTDADMIAALTTEYGTPVPRRLWKARLGSRVEIESGSPVARWEDSGHAVVLFHVSESRPTFRLMVLDTRLHELARAAETQAIRLDDQEAPSRETARQKKELADGRAATEKARILNKGTFRP